MDIFLSLVATFIFGYFSFVGFSHAFKQFDDKDDDFIGHSYITVVDFIMDIILFISKEKLNPQTHIKVYKGMAFLFGLLMILISIWIWTMVL